MPWSLILGSLMLG
jgi:hypothetical protein